jgi:competence protein ComFC
VNRFSSFTSFFRQFFAPPFCYECKLFLVDATILCERCFELIRPVLPAHIILTKKYRMDVFAIARYVPPLKNMILAKTSFNKTAFKDLAMLMWRYIPFACNNIDYIIPIPLHWSRFAKRGFNQTEIMARVLSKKTGKPILHALKRIKKTMFQSQVAANERFFNVQDAFVLIVDKALLKDKNILLIDDVMTTGATLQAAGKELLKGAPKSVRSAVAARV